MEKLQPVALIACYGESQYQLIVKAMIKPLVCWHSNLLDRLSLLFLTTSQEDVSKIAAY